MALNTLDRVSKCGNFVIVGGEKLSRNHPKAEALLFEVAQNALDFARPGNGPTSRAKDIQSVNSPYYLRAQRRV